MGQTQELRSLQHEMTDECQLDHENVKSTLSRLSQFFESQLLFYIERIFSYENDRVQLNTSYQLLVYPTPRTETLISTSTNL
jgi:hypothetical protein